MNSRVRLDEQTYREIVDFLTWEAELLDNRQFGEWLAALTEDIYYDAPIRVTRGKDQGPDYLPESAWLRENRKSLEMRIKRLASPSAFAEDPPSRTRHFVSNIRAWKGDREREVEAYSNLLVYRSRGDSASYDLFSGERRDLIRHADGKWKLARREILLDQTILGAQDLSILL
jgi:3-phenylpropionate/cinnamic acid dioxygenase small subunit